MVACAYNYSTLGAEAGGLSKTLSKKVLGGGGHGDVSSKGA